MTCKDCIHKNICTYYVKSLSKSKGIDFDTAIEHYCDEAECDKCGYFQDRSKFVELPCEIGARAYFLHRSKKGGEFIQNNLTVVGIHLKDTKGCRGVPRQEYLVVRSDPLNMSKHINLKEVGKTVFFTYEEAEKALKEQSDD